MSPRNKCIAKLRPGDLVQVGFDWGHAVDFFEAASLLQVEKVVRVSPNSVITKGMFTDPTYWKSSIRRIIKGPR